MKKSNFKKHCVIIKTFFLRIIKYDGKEKHCIQKTENQGLKRNYILTEIFCVQKKREKL